MSGGQTEKQVQLIEDFKPRIIMVTPSYMQVIIEEYARLGLDVKKSSLEIGIFGAEPWTNAMRRDIEVATDMDAVDIYGLSEVMGPGVASECVESKDGPVIWEDHFYPEIINPDTGELVADGEEGELVFTSLTKEAFPIIRYRTRDLTRLLPPTSRSFRRMGKIVGRSDDMLIVRGVNVFPTQIEELVLAHPELTALYQLVITRDALLDEVEVLAELQNTAANLPLHDVLVIKNALEARIKNLVGISAKVSVLPPGAIERTQTGKSRRVIDKRAKP
jgi:phenylacetate-CoA ligase